MRLLVSAFREERSAQANAYATTHLLAMLVKCGVTFELCIGTYKGKKEVSVQVTGFRNAEQAIELGRAILSRFQQECALLVIDNVASTVTLEGVQPLGLVTFAANQPDCDGHTQFLDGLYMYAQTYGEPSNDNSYAAPILKEVNVF